MNDRILLSEVNSLIIRTHYSISDTQNLLEMIQGGEPPPEGMLGAKAEETPEIEELPSVYMAIYNLLAAVLPPLAAYEFMKNFMKGDIKEAIFSLPGLNLLKTPEAFYVLIVNGLNMLPPAMREDVLDLKSVNILLEVLYSLKEVTSPNDLNDFYIKLKYFMHNVKRGAIILAGLLSGIVALCAAAGATVAGFASLAQFLLYIAAMFAANPVTVTLLGFATAFLAFLVSVCASATAFAAGGIGAFLVGFVSKLDPDDVDSLDREMKKRISGHLEKVKEEHINNHKKAQEAAEKKAKESDADPDLNPDDDDIIDIEFDDDIEGTPGDLPMLPPPEDEEMLKEILDTSRWRLLAGIK